MDYIITIYLIILSISDIRKKKIPLVAVLLPALAVILYSIVTGKFLNILLGIWPGLLLCGLALSLPGSLGIGDGLLGIVYGVLYGWKRTCLWILFGLILVAVYGVCMCIHNKNQKEIPLIPFLTVVHMGALML